MYREVDANDFHAEAIATTLLIGVNVEVAYKNGNAAKIDMINTILAANTELGDVTLNGAVRNVSGIGTDTDTDTDCSYVVGSRMALIAGLEGGFYRATLAFRASAAKIR